VISTITSTSSVDRSPTVTLVGSPESDGRALDEDDVGLDQIAEGVGRALQQLGVRWDLDGISGPQAVFQ